MGGVDALSKAGKGEMSEAFCYIVWGGEEGGIEGCGSGVGGDGSSGDGGVNDSHHAVVQSDDESFRQVVLQALQSNI